MYNFSKCKGNSFCPNGKTFSGWYLDKNYQKPLSVQNFYNEYKNGKYLVYWPHSGRFIKDSHEDYNGLNGWQYSTYNIEEAAAVDVELDYTVPEEGSIVWFDGWVIPKYAKNIKAARYFINFMCKPENALRNMDVTGYVSAIGGEEILDSMSDEEEFEAIDASYFFGPEADSVCVNPIMYPDRTTIERCGMMHDTDTEALLKMWSRVKGDSASAWTYILICLVLGGLVTAVVVKYVNKARRKKRYTRKRRRK